jgi:hypothetical protein
MLQVVGNAAIGYQIFGNKTAVTTLHLAGNYWYCMPV